MPGEGIHGGLCAFVTDGEEPGIETTGALETVASIISLALSNLSLRKELASHKAGLSTVQLASEALGTVLDENRLYKTVLVLTLELLDSMTGVIFSDDSRMVVEVGFGGQEQNPVLLALRDLNPGNRRSLRTTVKGGGVVGARIGRSGGFFYVFRETSGYTKLEEDTIKLVARQLARAQERSRLYETIENNTIEMTESLAAALESRDGTTGAHINRTQELVESIAHRLDLDAATIRSARFAAALHDIGKIGVPDAILNKPGKLDDKEWKIMHRHPTTGARILAGISGFEQVAAAVESHHERFDGKGYPKGISGEDIPVEARIISVVDAFDAMTNDRPYRKAMSRNEALAELARETGAQFDPMIVDALWKLVVEYSAETGRKAGENA